MGKNILMICYYFPPLTDVGCKRSVAMARYLKAKNWNPHVLSVRNPDRHYCSVGEEPSPAGVPVTYTFSLVNPIRFLGRLNGLLNRVLGLFGRQTKRNYFYEFLCIPDFFVGWAPHTIFKALKIIKRERIDYIYVSCSPFSASLIGVACRLLTGKKLILDYRDPYGLKLPDMKNSRGKQLIDAFFARLYLKYADLFLVTTDETRDAYMRQYPDITNRIYTVHNGFDTVFLTRGDEKFDKFTIVYTGQFYHNQNPMLNMFAENFFSALAGLKQEGAIDRENFQFVFYGDERQAIRGYAQGYGIGDIVSAHGRIGYQEVLGVLGRSHLQLLRIVKMMLSTKLFEGISLNVPFLATIPPGEAESLIRKYSPSSRIVTGDSVHEIQRAIREAMAGYRDGTIRENRVAGFLQAFSRERLTGKFMETVEAHFEMQGRGR